MNLLKGLPVLALSLLSACGDDNISPDYTYPETYEFRSMVSDTSNAVTTDKSTALQLMIEEFQVFFQKARDGEMTHLPSANFEARLNRILELGTLSGEDYNYSLSIADLYSTDDLPTQIGRSLSTPFELSIADYSGLEQDLALEKQIVGGSIIAPNLPNQVENDDGVLVGNFIGFPLLKDVPVEGEEEETKDLTNGNAMPKALVEAWLSEVVSMYDPALPVSFVNPQGMHLDILIEELLTGAVIYAQATNHNLNPFYGLASQNIKPHNQTEYDLAVEKHAEAEAQIDLRKTSIKSKERQEYEAKIAETKANEAYTEAIAAKEFAQQHLDGIDKAEDPNGWIAAKIELDKAIEIENDAYDENLDKTRKSNSATNTLRHARDSYDEGIKSEKEAFNDIPKLAAVTSNEYYWDGAFGFFGLLRDHERYSDNEILGAYDVDSNSDGRIQIESELVHHYARVAARIDATAALGNFDISKTVLDAFLQGRQIILANHGKAVQVAQGYQAEVAAYADTIAESWDKLIAANTIHYINKTLMSLQEPDPLSDLSGEYFANWSRLKGVALSIQFSPYMAITVEDLESVHEKIGTEPILLTTAIDQHISDLQAARAQLQTSYDFAETNVLNW